MTITDGLHLEQCVACVSDAYVTHGDIGRGCHVEYGYVVEMDVGYLQHDLLPHGKHKPRTSIATDGYWIVGIGCRDDDMSVEFYCFVDL